MKKNVGTYDALFRITFGFVGLAYCIVCANRRKFDFPWLMSSLFAMKIAEGIVRYCPTLALFGKNTTNGNNETTISASSIINEITND